VVAAGQSRQAREECFYFFSHERVPTLEKIPNKPLRIMIVAGESSGDTHAATLVNAIQQVSPVPVEFFGGTGPQLRAQSVASVIHTDDLSILGLLEIGRALPKFLAAYKKLKSAAVEQNADGVILVDWPDFNFRLARALHRRGLKVIYYISPQLWAWRSYRAESIQQNVDLLLTILPFEKEWYARRGVAHVEYVGHPLAGEVHSKYDRMEFCRLHKLDPALPIVSLLPGSRKKELQRILPVMIEAAERVNQRCLNQQRKEVQFLIVLASGRSPREITELLGGQDNYRVVESATREALAASDAAVVASGTATLEAALLNTPMVIVYKESFLNWHLLGPLINVEHYGLVNLIARRRLATELIQSDFTPQRLSQELESMLVADRNAVMRQELRALVQELGQGGAARRAAALIVNLLTAR